MLYITEAEVRRLLPMEDCIALMREAFERLASGEAVNHPRRRLVMPSHTILHYMAGSDGRYFGAKLYSTNPKHGARFLFLLFRSDGEPVAILEANHLGQIRTGAASGFATSLLARSGAHTVGLIGSGFQARTQLEAITAAIAVGHVRVWSRSPEKRAAFAREASAACRVPVDAVATAEEAVRGAGIVVTATNSTEPVLQSEWIESGTHINAMGSNQARKRELPPELVRRADLIVVDSLEQSRMESGDLSGLNDEEWSRVVELKDVASGRSVRKRPEAITLFKSNGIAVEDVVAAALVYERTVQSGAGRQIYS
jgi:ornithine cyclodeaminase/alanine dehydrogenase-like protein (mu-crystallin family)